MLSYLKTFKRLDLTAIPMAADTGPIGGNLSHEFIILAETGESKIYTDKRIFDLKSEGTKLEKKSLEDLRKKYEEFYSVTDEKFDKNEFEKKVSETNRLKTKGIEVGHIFKLGKKYTENLSVNVLDLNGKTISPTMGCYGIGVSRLVAAVIEQNHDEKGCIWTIPTAPYLVDIVVSHANTCPDSSTSTKEMSFI